MHVPSPKAPGGAKNDGTARTIALRLKPTSRHRRLLVAGAAMVAVAGTTVATLANAAETTATTTTPTTYSIWPSSTAPKNPSENDTQSVEVGTRFTTQTSGWVTGVRYYKSAQNTGTKVGKLWDSSGKLLGKVTFTGETGSGWQEATFDTPVTLKAGSNYVVSYRAPNGHYANDEYALSASKPRVSYALSATQGVYTYASGMPKQSWHDSNYYVDVVFTTVRPGTRPWGTATTTAAPTASTTTTPAPTTSTTTTTAPAPTTSTTSTTSTTTTTAPAPTTSTTSTTAPAPTTSTTTTTAPAPGTEVAGWQLTTANTGLARLGLQCASLPVYTGPTRPAAGTLISRVRFTSPLILAAGNITIEQSCMQPTSAWQGQPLISTTDNNTGATTPSTVTIRDSEIDGSKLNAYDAAMTTGFIGIANLQRNYIHDVGSGIGLMNTGKSLNSIVEGNYIRGLRAYGDGATTGNHSDAFTVRDFDARTTPGRTLVVRNNRFNCDSANATGAFFVQTYSGHIYNTTLQNNLLEGGGYQLGLESGFGNTYSNLSASNNRFTGTGWGAAYVQGGPGWTNWSENYLNDTTAPNNIGTPVGEPDGRPTG